MSSPNRPRLEAVAATVLVLLANALTLLRPAHADVDREEMLNVAQAVLLGCDPPALGLHLQYMAFCTGCTVDAWGARPLFAVLPPVVGVWKLLPATFLAVLAASGFVLLRAHVGRLAGWTFAVLLAFPPQLLGELLWRAWGNHVEAVSLSVLALALVSVRPSPARDVAAGLSLGLALIFAPTVAGTAAALSLPLIAERAWPRLGRVLGVAAALSLATWTVTALLADVHPLQLGAYADQFFADATVLDGLAALLHPRQLAAQLGPQRPDAGAVLPTLAVLTALASTALALRSAGVARVLALALVAWAVAYALSPFHLEWTRPGRPRTPLDLRYVGGVLPLVLLVVAAAVGRSHGEGRRWVAAVLVAPWLLLGVLGRAQAWSGPLALDHLTRRTAVDWELWAVDAGARDYAPETAAWLGDLHTDTPDLQWVSAWRRGHDLAEAGGLPDRGDDEAVWRGFGAALVPREGTAREALEVVLEQARARGADEDTAGGALYGAAWVLAAEPSRTVPPPTSEDPMARASAWILGFQAGPHLVDQAPFGTRPVPELATWPPRNATIWVEAAADAAARRWGPGVPPPRDLPEDLATRWRESVRWPVRWRVGTEQAP